MVLQQNSNVKIWGWSSPAEKILLSNSWNNKTDSVVADNNAKWQIILQTPSAGGPYTITIKGINTIILEDIMIGEVWVCSGQSNMEWSYNSGITQIREEFNTCNNTNIRFFSIPKTTSIYPQDNCNGQWEICDSNTLKSFSAIGYYYGKELNKELKVPIGLINSSWGGTPAEVWTPAELINNDSVLKEAASKLKTYLWWPNRAGYAYNAMIAPLINYSIAGVIWYQGEANTYCANTYSYLFNTMIESWRNAWKKNLPFYYVQIAPFKYKNKNICALLQEAQTKSSTYPNVGMVVVSDLVDNINNIHPQNKKDVGIRLANWALVETYHRKNVGYKSPTYKNMVIESDKIIVSFNDALNGLKLKGEKINEMYIAGEDKIFYQAEVEIENDKLVIWSNKVIKPVAVRYAFGNTAIGNLFSMEGLPVAPFRTDKWEVDIQAEK